MQRGDRAERAVRPAKLAGRSPFLRLNELLQGVVPGKPPISMAGGGNPGAGYIRVVLIDDLATTETALLRLNECLG